MTAFFKTRFRAKANMAAPEFNRRAEALERWRNGESAAPQLPEPIPCPMAPTRAEDALGIATQLYGDVVELVAASWDTPSEEKAGGEGSDVDRAPPPAARQLHPVTVEVSGPEGAGKSVVLHVIRAALADQGIAYSGADELRSLNWRRALNYLFGRGGFSVLLVKRETEAEAAHP
jgi:hypothetical protein